MNESSYLSSNLAISRMNPTETRNQIRSDHHSFSTSFFCVLNGHQLMLTDALVFEMNTAKARARRTEAKKGGDVVGVVGGRPFNFL